MVDVTFPFIVLFGGALVGFVTARVRQHHGFRKALDVLAAVVGSLAGTPLWLAFARHVLPRIVGSLNELPPGAAAVAADLYYMSPVIGALFGTGALALTYRLVGQSHDEPWLMLIGDGIKIVGIVYLAIALSLTVVLIAIAAYQARWDFISLPALTVDIAFGAAIVGSGWAMRRLSTRRTDHSL